MSFDFDFLFGLHSEWLLMISTLYIAITIRWLLTKQATQEKL